ncbi:hypothetical protein GCM10022419_067520 [Nonomuraea rosea]|jgi:hypothetical protein|uniref:Uncharacterized protein n=1 Tax=Nonomuraea rosea TaxID=638574 RepID=A0ABP6Y7V6_9ACTN
MRFRRALGMRVVVTLRSPWRFAGAGGHAPYLLVELVVLVELVESDLVNRIA